MGDGCILPYLLVENMCIVYTTMSYFVKLQYEICCKYCIKLCYKSPIRSMVFMVSRVWYGLNIALIYVINLHWQHVFLVISIIEHQG